MNTKTQTKKVMLMLITLTMGWLANAQQDPQFTQYMYNHSVINPAYATAEEGIANFGGFYRTQWVGLEGAPNTGSFFAHAPINDRMEAGISFTKDEIYVINQTNVFADFAYILPVSEDAKLSLGLKAGARFFKTDFTKLQFNSGASSTDIAFNENANKISPNVGVGAFYFTKKYYVGLSVPNLLNTTQYEEKNGRASQAVTSLHFFLTGGYVFDINKKLKLKPAFMVKGTQGAPLAIDITTNVLINNRLEVGLGYRVKDAITGLIGFKVVPELQIGYAYDYTLSNLGDYNSGSHEILLKYDFDFLGIFNKGFDRSPRFF